MPDRCGHGHLLAGDNVRRTTLTESARCRECMRAHARANRRKKSSQRKPRVPLDAAVVAQLRQAAGITLRAPVMFKRPTADQVARSRRV